MRLEELGTPGVGRPWIAENAMRFRSKVMLGFAAVAVASAASFPNELGALYLGPTSWQKREALSMCQQTNASFVRFLASDRENCYSRLRTATGARTGVWSRHDRERQLADAAHQTPATLR
jgi:hypothetical protein